MTWLEFVKLIEKAAKEENIPLDKIKINYIDFHGEPGAVEFNKFGTGDKAEMEVW